MLDQEASVKALTFSRFGGPEVLEFLEVPDPAGTPGQCLVALKAVGLNFADIYRRQGHYHLAGSPPWIAGYEGAGEVLSAPEGCGLRPGDRVAFADSPFANAEIAAVDLDRLIPLPADIPFATAAALLLQGLTAQYLVRAAELFARVREGSLQVRIAAQYALADGAAAHRFLEGRRAIGKVLLLP
jgi:NADPH2:quinone reductase